MVPDGSSTTATSSQLYLVVCPVRDTNGRHEDVAEDGVFRDKFLTASDSKERAFVQFEHHCDDLGFDMLDPGDAEVEHVTEPEQVAALADADSDQIGNWNSDDDSDVSASPQKLLDLLQQALSK